MMKVSELMEKKNLKTPKESYKDLSKHINFLKNQNKELLDRYSDDGEHSYIFDNLGKQKDRAELLDAFQIVQDILSKINV